MVLKDKFQADPTFDENGEVKQLFINLAIMTGFLADRFLYSFGSTALTAYVIYDPLTFRAHFTAFEDSLKLKNVQPIESRNISQLSLLHMGTEFLADKLSLGAILGITPVIRAKNEKKTE